MDPVQASLVGSLNRPGGNVSGVNYLQAELAAKQLGLLHELLPRATRFAVLVNPNNPVVARSAIAELQAAASSIGARIEVLRAESNGEIDAAFVNVSQERIEAPIDAYSLQRSQHAMRYLQCIMMACLPRSVDS